MVKSEIRLRGSPLQSEIFPSCFNMINNENASQVFVMFFHPENLGISSILSQHPRWTKESVWAGQV